ncbi:MAG: chlorosome protein C [Chloroherpetonaceae bacterium]|nr:chlorosome protein C [Chloroherpetonaceae bacterium]
MTESYETLRKEFKAMALGDRMAFLAEAAILTGQSAIVGTLNLIGDVVEGVTSATENLTKSVGITGGDGQSPAAQTVNRVVITVKDAGKAAGTVMKDVAKTVDTATADVAKGVSEAAAKAVEVVNDVASAAQKAVKPTTGSATPEKGN